MISICPRTASFNPLSGRVIVFRHILHGFTWYIRAFPAVRMSFFNTALGEIAFAPEHIAFLRKASLASAGFLVFTPIAYTTAS